MSRIRSVTVLTAAVLLSWLIAAPAELRAEPHGGPTGMMRGHHGGGGQDFVGHSLHALLNRQKDLGLSEEQNAKIRTISTDYTKTRIRGKADLKLAEVDVRSLMRSQADLPAIETAIKKAESTRTALRLEGVRALRAASEVLTPEQRKKWRETRMSRHSASVQPEASDGRLAAAVQESSSQDR
jgi:Spy/CpxP family protein refolding chaperone